MSFGFFIRGLTGLASRKQCIKMATNTGKELVDLMQSTGRNLTKADIDSVFERTLPKGFAPKIITEREELIPYFVKTGHTQETAKMQAFHPNMGAGTIPNGAGKRVVYLPLIQEGEKPLGREIALYAHELEHALEANHRIGKILSRKFNAPLIKILKKLKSGYLELINGIGLNSIKFECELQMANNTGMGYSPIVLNCADSIDELIRLNGKTRENQTEMVQNIIKKYADKNSKCSENSSILKLLRKRMELEIPAYTVEGEVQKYALNLQDGQIAAATGTARVYEDARKILKTERKTYIKNLLRGKLSKPTIYQTDKDLFNLFDNPADKELVKKYITGLNYQHKQNVFNVLSKNPDRLNTYIDFIKAVKQAGSRFSYRAHLGCLGNMSDDAMRNPDIIKIAGIGKDAPEYAYCLESIAKAKPERIAEFAQIAGEKTKDGCYKYTGLSVLLEHPKYETLKKFADIESKEGENIFANRLHIIKDFSNEKIDEFYNKAINSDTEILLTEIDEQHEALMKKLVEEMKEKMIKGDIS